ncbi:hypothetical protein PIB30_002388 [Stylosanthes scabra]|uniref:Uncharacterized protein n=1 Tax=Stylosanthes scabra TaxID=79078 RepID=A0ABU6V1V0_9FABA|nr:hypothetical protein [Stylosanthes scabra]
MVSGMVHAYAWEHNTVIRLESPSVMSRAKHHVCVEGRLLKSPSHSAILPPATGGHGSRRDNGAHHHHHRGHHEHESKRREGYEVEAFRPTSPGHSPGVGHSINN